MTEPWQANYDAWLTDEPEPEPDDRDDYADELYDRLKDEGRL
jgi:hypothetical protein